MNTKSFCFFVIFCVLLLHNKRQHRQLIAHRIISFSLYNEPKLTNSTSRDEMDVGCWCLSHFSFVLFVILNLTESNTSFSVACCMTVVRCDGGRVYVCVWGMKSSKGWDNAPIYLFQLDQSDGCVCVCVATIYICSLRIHYIFLVFILCVCLPSSAMNGITLYSLARSLNIILILKLQIRRTLLNS